MMALMRHLAVAALAFLLGCGEKAPESKEAPVSRPAARPEVRAEDPRPKIVFLGDSITAGFGVEPGHAFPDYVQRALDAKGYRYRAVNEGVSGDTTSNGLERLPNVIAQKPEIALVELGGNDGLRGIPIESTRANLDEIIRALQSSGARVALAGMTLPANYGPDYIARFERMYVELAARHKVKLIPFWLEKLGGSRAELMQSDGLHPTREGQRRLGEYVAGEIEPLLRK